MNFENSKNFNTFFKFPRNKQKRHGEGGLRCLNKKKISKKSEPLITIITVLKNSEQYLEATIRSVLNQSYKNFEYILIDGGSKDKSLKIIKKYSNKIDYWISENDKGIYDAFNKGMQLAKGDFIGIVNSDDTLEKDALKILTNYINSNPKIDFVFGSVKKHWGILYGYKPEKIKYSWGFYTSHSTGFYIKRKSAKKVGLYNLKYKYHADYDYFYRMIVKENLKGIGTKKNELFGNFRRGGFSSKIKFRDLFLEDLKVRYNNGQNIFLILIIYSYRLIKKFFN
jgi:glycosyltransferase involved in cell wall biosynthesis